MTAYVSTSGAAVRLGSQLGAGGEGTVFTVAGAPQSVAKLYHAQKLTQELDRKVHAMVGAPPADPTWAALHHHSIAWVEDLVFQKTGGTFAGVVMPFIETKLFLQAHNCYDPDDRARRFQGTFTWRHLLNAATNLASAVAAIHALGHRIGDLRETNVLVAPTGLITLVDCDSFQIQSATGEVFPSRVGTGEYLPREMHGIDFSRTPVDRLPGDLFALPVLIFKFLMNGVHPFQARGRPVDDAPTTEAKIRKGLFAFGGEVAGISPPQYALPYAIVPAELRLLFRRAFKTGHTNPGARPSAQEWVRTLVSVRQSLRKCPVNPNHWHGNDTCPWCAIIASGGAEFFPDSSLGAQLSLAPASGVSRERLEAILRSHVKVALADGKLSEEERVLLIKMGDDIGLRADAVDRLIAKEAGIRVRAATALPKVAPRTRRTGVPATTTRPPPPGGRPIPVSTRPPIQPRRAPPPAQQPSTNPFGGVLQAILRLRWHKSWAIGFVALFALIVNAASHRSDDPGFGERPAPPPFANGPEVQIAGWDELWHSSLSSEIRQMVLAGRQIVTLTDSGIRSVDAGSGERAWDAPLLYPSSWKVAFVGGRLLTVDDGPGGRGPAAVRSLDAGTGRPQWQRTSAAKGSTVSVPCSAGGTIVVAEESGGAERLLGLEAGSGKVKWSRSIEGTSSTDSVLCGAKAAFAFSRNGTPRALLLAVDLGNGKQIWSREIGGGPWSWTVGVAGSSLLLKSPQFLESRRASDGARTWRRDRLGLADGDIHVAGDAVIERSCPDSIPPCDYQVVAIQVSNGKTKWLTSRTVDLLSVGSRVLALAGVDLIDIEPGGGGQSAIVTIPERANALIVFVDIAIVATGQALHAVAIR